MIQPHLPKITIDITFILSKPRDSNVEDPSACLSLWSIDEVDFKSCTVFPQKSLDEVSEVVKSFTALEEQEYYKGEVMVSRKTIIWWIVMLICN
jgi:hypothetical protein